VTRTDLTGVVAAAAAGDERAWEALYRRFDPTLRRVARGFRLSSHEVEDALQATWLRAFRNLHRLENPAAIGGWLVTTARRESQRVLQLATREVPTEHAIGDEVHDLDSHADHDPLAAAERSAAIHAALDSLPARERTLLTLLSREPAPSYEEAAAELGVPLGSVGPTRGRALARLRRHPRLRALRGPEPGGAPA
jgi:RNA polymerase sigma factor (sigma-70 family)